MKFGINSKYKIWVLITIALLVVGITLLAIFGFNKSADFKNSYEVKVSVDSQVDVDVNKLEKEIDSYFESKQLTPTFYSNQRVNGPIVAYSYIYKFGEQITLDVTDFESYLSTKLDVDYDQTAQNNIIEVEYNQVVPFFKAPIGYIALALGISLVAIFLYLLIMEKLASALAVVLSTVGAGVLYMALLGLTRVPATPFAPYMFAFTFALSMLSSVGLVNRFKEQVRLNNSADSKEKLSFSQIADSSAKSSLFRYLVIAFAILLTSVLMVIFGEGHIEFLALNLLVAGASGLYASLIGTTLIWPLLKAFKKKNA